MIDRLRDLFDANPFDHADQRRRWAAASEVCDGVLSTYYTVAIMEGPRVNHTLIEGGDPP
ncbi:MAG: hypothetical protein ABEI76_08555 [Halobacteriales archaeon]